METLVEEVKLRVGDRLWDFNLSVDERSCLVVEPADWHSFQEAHPDGVVVEVFDYTFVMYPFR